jgi:hypothetical protein
MKHLYPIATQRELRSVGYTAVGNDESHLTLFQNESNFNSGIDPQAGMVSQEHNGRGDGGTGNGSSHVAAL